MYQRYTTYYNYIYEHDTEYTSIHQTNPNVLILYFSLVLNNENVKVMHNIQPMHYHYYTTLIQKDLC